MNHYAAFYKLKGWGYNEKYSTPLHKRHGSEWTKKEDDDLVKLMLQDTSLEEISKIHHRTKNSILTRLSKLRWKYECFNQISKFLTSNDINIYRRR